MSRPPIVNTHVHVPPNFSAFTTPGDVVATAKLPRKLARDAAALTGCIAGAATVDALHAWLKEAGFRQIRIEVQEESRAAIAEWLPGSGAEKYAASAMIEATKPRR